MKIKEITYKSGRDYWAIFICRSIFDGQSVLTITIGSDTLEETIATLREWEANHE